MIIPLGNDNFKVATIRPPMVYGKGCKGNYPKLVKLAKITPIFPDIKNQRSMIYIDNLSELVRLLIDDNRSGLFLPQNKEYVNTSEIVKLIAEFHGKEMRLMKIFNPLLRICKLSVINKVFGDLVYDRKYNSNREYQIFSNELSIKMTER